MTAVKLPDPKNGKTYSFNAKMSNDGKTLNGRGYIGIYLRLDAAKHGYV